MQGHKKKFQVYWAQRAVLDLDSIIDYLALENSGAAERILGKIQKVASQLKTFPERGRIVPELKEHGIAIYREALCPPWRIIYRIEAPRIWITAVIDGRRNPEDLLLQRLLQ